MLTDKILRAILHPSDILKALIGRGCLNALGDEAYVRLCYRLYTGKTLNLSNPRTFNEKIQWLKLRYRRPEYTNLVDKYRVRDHVAKIVGEEYLIPFLGVWERAEDIDFDTLPDQFVLKCNHISGTGICICKDKSKLDIPEVRNSLSKAMRKDFYLAGREWPYKNVPRRIIAEQYMTDDGIELKDYKVFCFDGEPKLIQVDFNRFSGHKRNLYTPDWKYVDGAIHYPTDPNVIIPKPETLDTMLELARKLSRGFPHIRTDFYSVGGKVYFGELTLYHECGYGRFMPESLEETMGDWIKLPL